MNADYITHYGTDLSAANAARVSMNKESDWDDRPYAVNLHTGEESCYGPMPGHLKAADAKLIDFLAKNKHTSCFEHQGVTLRLKVPLFVRSQIHRHRTFSYNEISRRYVKDDLEFYWPEKWRKAAENVKQGSSDESVNFLKVPGSNNNFVIGTLDEAFNGWSPRVSTNDYERIVVRLFNEMVEQGCCAEQARMILPQNLYTQFYMTGSLRNFAHFLKLRLDTHAQKEIQEVAQMCADIIRPLFPCSYEALMKYE